MFWAGLSDDASTFNSACLHCVTNTGEIRFLRLHAHTLHAERPNESILFDFVDIGETDDYFKYILIVNDDFGIYIWLRNVKACPAKITVESLF